MSGRTTPTPTAASSGGPIKKDTSRSSLSSLLSALSPRSNKKEKEGIPRSATQTNGFIDRATLSAVIHECLDGILIPVLIPIILE
jgi:hypothetical protein